MLNNHKECTKCKDIKSFSEFRIRNNKPISNCKECDKKYAEQNKEKIAKRNKEWREANKELLSKKNKDRKLKIRQLHDNTNEIDLSSFYDIPDYEGIYKINKNGDVLSLPNITNFKCRLKIPDENKGYLRTSLFKNGKGKHFFIHQLVGKTFIPNPENKPHINHIDGNPKNNNVSNLEWCTPLENVTHSILTGLAGTNRCRKHKTNKSGYIGVHWHKVSKKYLARIRLKDGERKSLGFFDNVVEAAKAYDKALLEIWGREYEFNFPELI